MMDDIFGDGTSTNCFRRFMQMCCLLRVNSLFPMANESTKSSMHNNDLDIVNISVIELHSRNLNLLSKQIT